MWRRRKFSLVWDWIERVWDDPLQCPPHFGMVCTYLMAVRAEMIQGPVDINGLKIRLSKGGALTNPFDEDISPYDSEENNSDAPKQEVEFNLSSRIKAAGGRVRIRQSDGSLRMYDVNQGKYVE